MAEASTLDTTRSSGAIGGRIFQQLESNKTETGETEGYKLIGDDKSGLQAHYRGKSTKDPEEVNNQTETAVSTANEKIDSLSEHEYSIAQRDANIDGIGSLLQTNTVVFGPDARKHWLKVIRELKSNFNKTARKSNSFLLSSEQGKDYLNKIFLLTTLRTEDGNQDFEDVRKEARGLINAVLGQTRRNSKQVSINQRDYIQQILGADTDKAAIKGILNLVENVGLIKAKGGGVSGIGQFADPDRGFLAKVRDYYGGDIGKTIADSLFQKINTLLSGKLDQQSYEFLEDEGLNGLFTKLKTEFFDQIQDKLDKEIEKAGDRYKLTDEEKTLVDARVNAYKNVYLATDDEAAQKAAQELYANFVELEGQLSDKAKTVEDAKTSLEELKGAASNNGAQTIVINRDLIEDNWEAKREWTAQLLEDAITTKNEASLPPAIALSNITKELEKLKNNAIDKNAISMRYHGIATDTGATLNSSELDDVIKNISKAASASGPVDFEVGSNGTTVDLKAIYDATKAKLETEAIAKRDTLKVKAEAEIVKFENAFGAGVTADQIRNIGLTSIANQDNIHKILGKPEDSDRKTYWSFKHTGTSDSKRIARKLSGYINKVRANFENDHRKFQRKVQNIQLTMARVLANAQSINYRVADVFTNALMNEEGEIQEGFKDILSERFSGQLEGIKQDLEARSGDEAKENLSKSLLQSLVKLDSQESILINGKSDVNEMMVASSGSSNDTEAFMHAYINLGNTLNTRKIKLTDEEQELLTTGYPADPAEAKLRAMQQKVLVLSKLSILKEDSKLKENTQVQALLSNFNGIDSLSKNQLDKYNQKLKSISSDFESEKNELESNEKILELFDDSSQSVFDLLDMAGREYDSDTVNSLRSRVESLVKTVSDNITTAFGADDSYHNYVKTRLEKSNGDYADDSFAEMIKAAAMQTLAA